LIFERKRGNVVEEP